MTGSDLDDRIEAVAAFNRYYAKLVVVGELTWDSGFADLRLLATSYLLRRQQEALEASVQLARSGLGHLIVSFIRPAPAELLWMSFMRDLDQAEAQKLMGAMGHWDARRSLAAQRNYVGDAVMHTLWYPTELLDQQQAALATTKADLKARQAVRLERVAALRCLVGRTGGSRRSD